MFKLCVLMDRSGFPLSSAHRTLEQDACTNTPNDILHESAARAKYTNTHDRVCQTTIIAVVGQMGERAQLIGWIGPFYAAKGDPPTDHLIKPFWGKGVPQFSLPVNPKLLMPNLNVVYM